MALIHPAFLDSVVCVGKKVPGVAQPQWFGTGFIVGLPAETKDEYHTFLVTNRHVLEKESSVVIRFNSDDGSKARDYTVDLIDRDGVPIWSGHKNPEIDVACFWISPKFLADDHARFGFFALDRQAFDVKKMIALGVSEGDGIFVLGFPLGIVGEDKKHVIARSGIVARIRDVLEGTRPEFLIDASVFPGNSGGPVLTKLELAALEGTQNTMQSALIGMVKSYLPFNDVAVSQQTGKPRVIFEENSGLALVETVDSIAETVKAKHDARQNAGKKA